MEAWMMLFLDDNDVAAAFGKQRSNRRAGRTTADNDNLTRAFHRRHWPIPALASRSDLALVHSRRAILADRLHDATHRHKRRRLLAPRLLSRILIGAAAVRRCSIAGELLPGGIRARYHRVPGANRAFFDAFADLARGRADILASGFELIARAAARRGRRGRRATIVG